MLPSSASSESWRERMVLQHQQGDISEIQIPWSGSGRTRWNEGKPLGIDYCSLSLQQHRHRKSRPKLASLHLRPKPARPNLLAQTTSQRFEARDAPTIVTSRARNGTPLAAMQYTFAGILTVRIPAKCVMKSVCSWHWGCRETGTSFLHQLIGYSRGNGPPRTRGA